MKRGILLAWLAAGLGGAWGGALRPSAIVYGVIRDAYGIRLNAEEQVSVFLGSNEVARTAVATYPDGVNYRIELDVYDPLSAAPGQVIPGSLVQVKVRIGASFSPLIGTNTFLVPGDGSAVRVDLVAGADGDGDGIPDAWELMVIVNSGGRVSSLAQVGPGHDLDGDGLADDAEFWYGSFAFLPGDELRTSEMRQVGGRWLFRFLSVLGTVYRVQQATNLRAPVWTNAPIALAVGGPFAPGEFTGNGNTMDVYINPAPASPVYYRLQAR